MNIMLGALVGDAAGATLEGRRESIRTEDVEHALTMPGGGVLRVGPGQITDDGELTLALWRAIHTWNPADGFPIYCIIKQYADWYDSCPFDIGQTCAQAFELWNDHLQNVMAPHPGYSDEEMAHIKREIYRRNRGSQANGALMRVTALAAWIAPYEAVSAEQAAEFAMEEATLSHPHPVCQETNAIYVYTLVNLLRGVSPLKALDYTNEFVVMNDFSPEVKDWYFNESQNIDTMNCVANRGHVRWAFVLAFYFLRHPTIGFEEAIRQTLLKGGDTDTNACIVGGMVAAYHPIPSRLLDPVLVFDCTKRRNLRPPEYSVRAVLGPKAV
jgi:ADP-ribosylglycohydrolase